MRKRLVAVVVAVLTVAGVFAVQRVNASPSEEYSETHFGAGNLPAGCEADSLVNYTDNVCYHQRTGMNGLDDPKVDVLILAPVSPAAERDTRIMRQAVEMWDGGINNLSPQMGVDWLGNGMRFNIQSVIVDANNPTAVPYPMVDPEIVLITTNPVGGAGIGIDPVNTYSELINIIAPGAPGSDGEVPCTGIENPFDLEAWQDVPGFDAHHTADAGIYNADCKGQLGGNICFAVNGAIDPAPDTTEVYSLFDLVAHEFGHCLTIGHVGDGAEGPWGKVPTNDIMSYNADPVGLNKCVSTLDVESVAVSMSKFLDANNDGVVNDDDKLDANDQPGDGRNAFQTQHPRDHHYASGTGKPTDCPQPDLGIVPGPTTDWEPAPVSTTRNVLTVTSPTNNATTPNGNVNVTGTVERQSSVDPDPTSSSITVTDKGSDAKSPYTEIKKFTATVTDELVDATISIDQLPPTGENATSPTTYSLYVDGRRFDSFVLSGGAELWDNNAAAYLPNGSAKWNTSNGRVRMLIPRSYLAQNGVTAPYQLRAESSVGNVTLLSKDDSAPEGADTVGVAAPAASSASVARVPAVHVPLVGAAVQTVTFQDDADNTFYPENSTFGVTDQVGLDNSRNHKLELPQPSNVTITLDWTDGVGGSDLDLGVTNAGIENTEGVTGAKPEVVTLENVVGTVNLKVIPYIVTDELAGSTYTLTANVNPTDVDPPVDTDNDGVPDATDACPTEPGNGADGCPIVVSPSESVRVLVDGLVAGESVVDTSNGVDHFSIPVTIGAGTHAVRTEWIRFGRVAASETRSVTFGTPTPVVLPKLTIADATTVEGKAGTKVMGFKVTLDKALATDLTLKATPSNGTAKSPEDFVAGATTFTIKAGKTVVYVPITIRGDAKPEETETFNVKVTGTGVQYARSTAKGTITDDDTGTCIDLGSGPLACIGANELAAVPLP